MKECFNAVSAKVKATLEKKVKYKGFSTPISSEAVVTLEFFYENTSQIVSVNKKGLRSLITKLQDLNKKIDKIVIDHPELPLK
jgi:hypothetical protein